MDDVKNKKVIVIATVNNRCFLPESLQRDGRFDEKFEIKNPKGEDAKQIIKYFLSQKKYIADLDIDEISKLLNGFSCAELENLINKAGITAAFDRKDKIEMDDILKAYIRNSFNAPISSCNRTEKQKEMIAYHETGHAIVGELLQPNSVTLISIANNMGCIGGFTSYYECDDYWVDKQYMENRIMTLLAGMAITELKFGKTDMGSYSDIDKARSIVKQLLTELCEFGFSNITRDLGSSMPTHIAKEVAHELEKYYLKTKELLAPNMIIVDKVAKSLMKKETLSRAEIVKLMKQ